MPNSASQRLTVTSGSLRAAQEGVRVPSANPQCKLVYPSSLTNNQQKPVESVRTFTLTILDEG
jgi:hypothetical protein